MKMNLLVLLALAFGFGCTVGPRYHPPLTPVPTEWKNPVEKNNCLLDVCNWWEIFEDARLNELEATAISNNPNLFVAMARVEEAWSLAGVKRADLFPQLSLNPYYSDTGQLFKIFLPQTFSNFIPTGSIKPFRITQFQYALPLNLSYEVDLWGKNRLHYRSALMSVAAQQEAYLTTLLTLTTDLASSYFNLRILDATIDFLEKTLSELRKDYELSRSRYTKGLTNYFDVTRAFESLANTESDYYEAKKQRGLQENLIGALIGFPASDFCLEAIPIFGLPPEVPAGMPSTLLLRRPDIAQAERTMASDHALIGATYATFFPSLDLTGAIGFFSPDFRQFLQWISRYWNMGVNVNQTVFDGGRKYSNLEQAIAVFREANGTYQQQVLIAFREVEDALNNLDFQAKQAESLRNVSDAATQAAKMAKNRYERGLVNQIEAIEYELTALNAYLNYVNVNGLRYQSTIQLIKAIGGRW